MKVRASMIVIAAGLAVGVPCASAAENAVPQMLARYQAEGAGEFSAERGKRFWTAQHVARKEPLRRSCTTCHGTDLRKAGEHRRTGKPIKPMAPSVNPERFTSAKKIEKWFRRNCKWTLGRECTSQEKGDVLTWLNSL